MVSVVVNDKALNIKIPEKLYNDLKAAAERKNISLASLVRMFCSEGIERGVSTGVRGSTVDEIFNALPGV